MRHRTRLPAPIAGVLLFLFVAGAGPARGADPDALLQQMTTLNSAAIEDYSAGDFDKAKGRLLQAVAIAKKEPSLRAHPMLARTYLHLGALYVDGFEDRKVGIGYFVKALKIRSDIDMTESLVTKTVTAALEDARKEAGVPAATSEAVADTAGAKDVKEEKEAKGGKDVVKETEGAAAVVAEKKAPERTEKGPSAKEVAAARAAAKEEAARLEKEKRAEAEAKDKLAKALAAAEANQAKERAAKEKLAAEKVEKDKAIAEGKAHVALLEKDKADKEKLAAAERERSQKELAALKDSEAKERAAKEKLAVEKQASEKSLAEVKAQLQQVQADKADKEKQLAATAEREKKEKEAKEKLLAEKQASETREKERKAKEEAARLERERLAAGPDLPSRFADPLYCNIPDEVPVGTELFVHCAAKPGLNAKAIALYYRSAGSTHFNSVELEPGKKGWQMTVLPATRLSGKALQYFVEALDGRGNVVASNGKAGSPNILALRAAGGGLKSATFVKKK